MAESERIEILIKAVDEYSTELKKATQLIVDGAKKQEKANKSLSQSFSKVQGAMLNLGQAAQQIHNIFEIQQNRTRLLENAQDRLENSTLRLKQAQQDLLEVERSSARNQLDVEKATLANARAQKELFWFTERVAAGSSFSGQLLKDYEDAQIAAKEAGLDLADAQQKVADEAQNLKDKQDALTIANNNTERAQRALNKAIGDAKWAYVDMGMQALAAVGSLGTFISTIWSSIPALGGATAGATALDIALSPLIIAIGAIAAVIAYTIYLWNNWATMSDSTRLWMALLLAPVYALVDVIKTLQAHWQGMIDWFKQGWDYLKQFAEWLDNVLGGTLTKILNMISNVIGAVGSAISYAGSHLGGGSRSSTPAKKNDFIMRPGQGAVSFSSDDTIVGMKDFGGMGGGITIEIENIYGMNPRDVSRALLDELNNKLSQ